MSADDVELAHELASAAAEVALRYAGGSVEHELKSDGSPVSAGDLAVEARLIELLSEHRPDDGILSEESGEVATGRRRWVLDPIDGTANFITGGPDWGTHVALEVEGSFALGIITRPTKRMRWWAVAGDGAWRDADAHPTRRANKLSVSDTDVLPGARVGLFTVGASPLTPLLERAGAEVARGGSLILDLVEGRVDAVVADDCGAVWDHAPAIVLVTMAGGRFTDPEGGTRADMRAGTYTNGRLDVALERALEQ